MRRGLLALALAGALLAAGAAPAAALDSGVAVTVDTWTSGLGHGYVGVRAAGHWARPGSASCLAYYSVWTYYNTIPTVPPRDWWQVTVHRCSGEPVGPAATNVVTTRTTPGIGVSRRASGVLRLDLGVAVSPATAPAGTVRSVTAALSGDWQGAVADDIGAQIVPGSVAVGSWTVDFGDGSVRTVGGVSGLPTRLATTHAYGAGSFTVTVTAHVSGRAYGAFFAPDGTPYETTVPWSLDIVGVASGASDGSGPPVAPVPPPASGPPVDYLPPVVRVGASPSGTLPDGTAVPPDAAGHAALFWPRGLPCTLYPRAIVVTQGLMRSDGAVVGRGTTRLVSYRYTAGTNDAARPTPSGWYLAATPIQIEWATPLPGGASYPVSLVLTVQTTYDDGTVRTTQVAGVVSVAVVYSAAAQ